MNINDVINEAIIAIYESKQLADLLILKGGSAMRLFDKQNTRLSIDADFSIENKLADSESVFNTMRQHLVSRFKTHDLHLIDFTAQKKPKRRQQGFPEWWGGWSCEFKLVDKEYNALPLETMRRYALVPAGANSPKIKIDLSEYEYCGIPRTAMLKGITIRAYSREMLVLEKLRAICQQHPEYPYRQQAKNRARDFYDIYYLVTDATNRFIQYCKDHLETVFNSKEVPLHILGALWNDDSFIDGFRRGFTQVKDTVSEPLQEFDFYLESTRFFVLDICPNAGQFINSP